MTVFAQFCYIVFTMYRVMHILPLPLCGLYSIRAAELLWETSSLKYRLVKPRGITDLFSFMRNKYVTRARPTIQLVEPSINNHIVGVIHEHHITIGK